MNKRTFSEPVAEAYARLVQRGSDIERHMLGYRCIHHLDLKIPYERMEIAVEELQARIMRHHSEVCLDVAKHPDGEAPWIRLMKRCFSVRQWPISGRSMVNRLCVPNQREARGLAVHGVKRVNQEVGGQVFDRIGQDAHQERRSIVMKSLPGIERIRTASLRHATIVLPALLKAGGVSHRQIADLLVALGALRPGTRVQETKTAERLVGDGERQLAQAPVPQRKRLVYAHHPILELIMGSESFLTLLVEQPRGLLSLLAAMAPDLRAQKVRMALVDRVPSAINAGATMDVLAWPYLIDGLPYHQQEILSQYAHRRQTRADVERTLAHWGITSGHPVLRPLWRMFLASSWTRAVLTGHASRTTGHRMLDGLHKGFDADLELVAPEHRDLAQTLATYAHGYLCLDRVDLLVLEGQLSLAQRALGTARRVVQGHPRFQPDLVLREVMIDASAWAHGFGPSSSSVSPDVTRFDTCEDPDVGLDNLRQYLVTFAPDAARTWSAA